MTFYMVVSIFIIYVLYQRYVPVRGIKCINSLSSVDKNKAIIDVRDFQDSSKDNIQGSVAIPLAYLKRSAQEVANKEIIVIVDHEILLNLSVRLLRKQGFKVIGVYFVRKDHDFIGKRRCYDEWPSF